jgi:hypothetical protein
MSDGENPETYPLEEESSLDKDPETTPDPFSLDGLQVVPNMDDGSAELPPQEKGEWYVADASGNRQGPFNLEVLRTRIELGELGPDTLLWRRGLSGWTPAGSVTEVASLLAAEGSIAPPPLPKVRKSPAWKVLNQAFSDHVLIRMVGRLSFVASVVIVMVSLGLWYWGYTWFTGSLILFAVWVNCEAAGAMLEAIAELKR